jgi:hypothetical protein
VTWSPHANRATNAPFTVYDGATPEGTFRINEQLEPRADATLGGRPFQRLGTFNLSSTPSVKLSDDANGYVIADAVQFVRLGDLADMLDVALSVEQALENSGTVSATVTRTGATDAALEVTLTSSDTSAATVPATVTIAAGASSASFLVTVVDDAVLDATQTVTITAAVSGLLSGTDTLRVLDDEGLMIDDGDSVGYSNSASGWFAVSSTTYPGFGGDWRYHAAGSGSHTATWAATSITPGQYQVLVTWAPFSNRATNAPFTVSDGAAMEGVFPINQQVEPTADATVGGRPFQRLGTFHVSATSLTVTLSDQADGYVIADAVQFVRVGELLATELSVALAADSAYERVGTVSATVTRTGATTDALEVSLSSSDTTEAMVPATVTIPAGQASASFDVTVVDDTVADGTQVVTIAAAATGVFPGADALQVTDNELIDDEDTPGYSETISGWVRVSMPSYPGYANDWRYHAAGSGLNVAQWESPVSSSGLYQVLVTWAPYSNRATNAPFTVWDGPDSEGTFSVDQRNAPTADATAGGRPFQRLGTTFLITSSSVRVTLSDNANGYVIADAVQIVPVSPLRAVGGLAPDHADLPSDGLTSAAAQSLLPEAAARWQAAGFEAASAANVQVVIADLAGDLLGWASSAANTIWLDTDAAGYGWFVDATPSDDEEFGAEPDDDVADRIDALSVIFHEIGHLQGFSDVDALLHPDDPMADLLAAGVRRTSSQAAVAANHDAALREWLGE